MGEWSTYTNEIRLLTKNIILEKENARLREIVRWQSSRIEMLGNQKYKFLLNKIIKSCKLHKH